MGVPPGNRPAVPRDWSRGVPERYVAGADTRGRQEGRPNPRSQQVIHGIYGLKVPDETDVPAERASPCVSRIGVARLWRWACHREIQRYHGIGPEAY
jgi:hypothetical protein